MKNPLKQIFDALFKPADDKPDVNAPVSAPKKAAAGTRVATADMLTPPAMSVIEFDRNPELLKAVYNHVRDKASDTIFGRKKGYLVEFDVTNLGMINQLYGHEVGTAFLKVAAQATVNYFRYLDDKTDLRYMYHSGGDEFTVILQGDMSEENVNNVMTHTISLFEEYVVIKNGLHQLPHHKHRHATGAGISFRVAPILPSSPDYETVAENLHIHMASEKGSIEMNQSQTTWSNGSQQSRTSLAAYDSERLRAEVLRMIKVNNNGLYIPQKLPEKVRMPPHAVTFDGIGARDEEAAAINNLKEAGHGGVLRVEIGSLSKVNGKYGREIADGIIASLAKVVREETKDAEGVALFRAAGGTFDIVINDASPEYALDLQHRIYARMHNDIFKYHLTFLKETGLIFPYVRLDGKDAAEVSQTLTDMGRLQTLHDVSFIEGGAVVYPVNASLRQKRVLEGVMGDAGLAIPFATALRQGLDAEEFDRVLLRPAGDTALFLYGARDAELPLVLLGQQAARFSNLLKYDVPSLHQGLYTDMLANDPLPKTGVESVIRSLAILKQAAHTYNDPALFDASTQGAFVALYAQVADNFAEALKQRGEGHLASLWAECRKTDLSGEKISEPLRVIADALQKLSDKAVAVGVIKWNDADAKDIADNIAKIPGNLNILKAQILSAPGFTQKIIQPAP